MTIEEIIKSFGISRSVIAEGIKMKTDVFRTYMCIGFPPMHQEKIEKFLNDYSEKLQKRLTKYKRKY